MKAKENGCGMRLLGLLVGVGLIAVGLLIVKEGMAMTGTPLALLGGLLLTYVSL